VGGGFEPAGLAAVDEASKRRNLQYGKSGLNAK
jgi:hypothetical protein